MHTFAAPRIATVCIRGKPATARATPDRIALLRATVAEIDRRWKNLDAVLFPGGFVNLGCRIEAIAYAEQLRALAAAGLVQPFRQAARLLRASPQAIIVAGIDCSRRRDSKDQLCVAWNAHGIVGIGQKIFPGNKESRKLRCYSEHYASMHRVVGLACGHAAVLCACYDAFGLSECEDRRSKRTSNIRWLDDKAIRENGIRFRAERRGCLKAWQSLLKSHNVTVALVAIHGFKHSATAYWQRHGIATGSAALAGGFVVGAAHFHGQLPRDATTSTLSAARVRKRHLDKAQGRTAHSWRPFDHFTTDNGRALIRLFGTTNHRG